MIKFNFSLV